MRVYIAGAYGARNVLRLAAEMFEEAGNVSTARWLDATHDIVGGTQGAALDHDDAYTRQHVAEDFEDIDAADALVLFTPEAMVDGGADPGIVMRSGGRHVETGYALARGKHVIVVGPPENIFHRGACTVVPDVYAVFPVLRELDVQAADLPAHTAHVKDETRPWCKLHDKPWGHS